jgi:carboxylesterase type B
MLARALGSDLFVDGHHTCHADELFLLFKSDKIPIDGVYTEADKQASQTLLKIWTDFVKTANPSPNWTKSVVVCFILIKELSNI